MGVDGRRLTTVPAGGWRVAVWHVRLLRQVIHRAAVQVEELPDCCDSHVIERAPRAPRAELLHELARLLSHRHGNLGTVRLEPIRDFLRAVLEERGGRALTF